MINAHEFPLRAAVAGETSLAEQAIGLCCNAAQELAQSVQVELLTAHILGAAIPEDNLHQRHLQNASSDFAHVSLHPRKTRLELKTCAPALNPSPAGLRATLERIPCEQLK